VQRSSVMISLTCGLWTDRLTGLNAVTWRRTDSVTIDNVITANLSHVPLTAAGGRLRRVLRQPMTDRGQ